MASSSWASRSSRWASTSIDQLPAMPITPWRMRAASTPNDRSRIRLALGVGARISSKTRPMKKGVELRSALARTPLTTTVGGKKG